MNENVDDVPQDPNGEIVTCAEELPHLDLQEYIYDCARKLFFELPGQSYHVVIVTNTIEQHAELLLANDMELQNVQVKGAAMPFRMITCSRTGSITRRSRDREAMESLLLECKRLLAERTADQNFPSPQDIREQILENARKCFPSIVEDYTTGRITRTVIDRDSKYRPVPREVPLILPESEIFDIAIARGPERSLQASLIYGASDHEDLKIAMHGEGKPSYYEAIHALLEATAERLSFTREDVRVSPSIKSEPDREDSPMRPWHSIE